MEKIRKIIEDFSLKHSSIILVLPIVLLIIGFFVWAVYLFAFGFLENEILRAKFMLGGFTFLLITISPLMPLIFIFLFLSVIYIYPFEINTLMPFGIIFFVIFLFLIIFKVLLKRSFKDRKFKKSTLLLIFLWLIAYSVFIFPIIPAFLGGGHPRSLSLVTSKENILVLNTFDIKNAPGGQFQTENLCVIHENSKAIYVLKENRILMLDQSLFTGLISLPGINFQNERICTIYAYGWLLNAIVSPFITPPH